MKQRDKCDNDYSGSEVISFERGSIKVGFRTASLTIAMTRRRWGGLFLSRDNKTGVRKKVGVQGRGCARLDANLADDRERRRKASSQTLSATAVTTEFTTS
jgi:hypothetical protein